MEIKSFAPVIIPTLNRYDHFSRCVESLAKCAYAEKTDLFIGLDYPPTELYVSGWEKIRDYIPSITGFKSVTVFIREYNLGSAENASSLKDVVRGKYDCFIFTEDDNIFSPNFLEYMNWGLETFRDDPSVISICGYKRVCVDFLKNNIYKHIGHNAWGFGSWFKKWDRVDEMMNKESVIKILKNKPLSIVFSPKIKDCYYLMRMLKYDRYFEDSFPFFLPIGTNYSIFPRESKVRNTGHDGSGEHCGSSPSYNYSEQVIDTSAVFTPVIMETLENNKVETIYKSVYRLPLKAKILYATKFIKYKLVGNLGGIK